MELMERIEQQMAATQLPLFAITLAAVPCPDTPLILTLHWHAFVRERFSQRCRQRGGLPDCGCADSQHAQEHKAGPRDSLGEAQEHERHRACP